MGIWCSICANARLRYFDLYFFQSHLRWLRNRCYFKQLQHFLQQYTTSHNKTHSNTQQNTAHLKNFSTALTYSQQLTGRKLGDGHRHLIPPHFQTRAVSASIQRASSPLSCDSSRNHAMATDLAASPASNRLRCFGRIEAAITVSLSKGSNLHGLMRQAARGL